VTVPSFLENAHEVVRGEAEHIAIRAALARCIRLALDLSISRFGGYRLEQRLLAKEIAVCEGGEQQLPTRRA
jgi:hypothetical protein